MPSFDIISEFDIHEAKNAVDQANKEVTTRFDFKGTDSNFEINDTTIVMESQSTFQLQQMFSVLCSKLTKRGIDIACMELGDAKGSGKLMRQEVQLKQGIESFLAKNLVKLIKDNKLKVQTAIQGEKLRVTGKNRDDLQATIQFLRASNLEQPLQFDNFRD